MSSANLQAALDAIEAAIEAKATGIVDGDVKAFNIDGLSVTEYTLTELLEWQTKIREAQANDGEGYIVIGRRIPTQ